MTAELLTLHAIRLRGMADGDAIAARFALDRDEVEEVLLDQQAYGRVEFLAFGPSQGWSLTERGKAHGELLLAGQLDAAGLRADVEASYAAFLTHNTRLREVVTRWQLRPTATDPYAENDHRDRVWDSAVLADLRSLSIALVGVQQSLDSLLPRMAGYDTRFTRALRLALAGEREWVAGVGIDSCHTVWFELHEDYLATLGAQR